MKYGRAACITAIALFTLLPNPVRLAAEQSKVKHHKHKVVDIGTFGGPSRYFIFTGSVLNDHGSATGTADTSTFGKADFGEAS